MTASNSRPGPGKIWLLAIRPRTLPAAAAPVVVGTAVALTVGSPRWGPALAALAGALLIQIGTNLANDVFDHQRGADTPDRLGPVRVTQAGLLRPAAVLAGMWTAFGLAVMAGLYLTWVAGWPVVMLGVASIAAGIAYTGGPFPLAYHGLAEPFVFAFFGVAAVAGTTYVQTLAVPPLALAAAVPMGLLATAILAVNNIRDLPTDRHAGKRTLAVRLGPVGARVEYALLVAGAYLAPVAMVWGLGGSAWLLLPLATLPVGVVLTVRVARLNGRPLNRVLAATGQLELVYAALLAAGLVLGGPPS